MRTDQFDALRRAKEILDKQHERPRRLFNAIESAAAMITALQSGLFYTVKIELQDRSMHTWQLFQVDGNWEDDPKSQLRSHVVEALQKYLSELKAEFDAL